MTGFRDSQHAVKGKLCAVGEIVVRSPLTIGAGCGEDGPDICVIRNHLGEPYIPATSLTGVLRHYFKSHAGKEDLEEKDIEEFWGSEYGRSKNNNTIQSAFTINDLFLQGRKTIKVRDGVRISTQTGVVATDEKGKGAKYDYEILEPGARFAFFCETTLREGNKEGAFKRILEYLFRVLQVEKVSLGAMTMKGFGRVKLENLKCYEFDFSRKKDVINWLARDFDGQGSRQFNVDEPITDLYNGFTIDAWFSIRNSLIVRAYSGEPQAPDASHIGYSTEKDGEIPILPGTSGKGAIRHRALRIVKTLGGEEGLIKKLMGFVDIDEGNRDTEKIKSRLLVEETVINNTVSAIQHRIKIDRFTGGVINGALFDSMPIWPAGNNREMVNLRLAVVKDCAAWEAGLLLLVLKDLWNGDLAIGGEKNIGRGTLQGVWAEMKFSDEKITIKNGDNGRIEVTGDMARMEGCVQDLVALCNRKEEADG